MDVPRKYGLLRAISFILKLLAWLVLLAGIAGLVIGLLVRGQNANLPAVLSLALLVAAVAAPLMTLVWFVQLFAFGSILSLLVDIEESARALAVAPPE